MKLPRSTKKRLEKLKEPIIEEIRKEQELQSNLRLILVTSKDGDEETIAKTKALLNESIEHWEVLMRSLEEYEKLSKGNWNVSPDTLLVVGGNLVGILLILNFEKLDIVRSKAIGFVLKGRV